MTLEKLIANTSKADFETALEEFLNERFDELPLEEVCEHGGFPDPEDWEVHSIERVSNGNKAVEATFTVRFTESVNTSCGNVVIPHNHNVDCRIKINKMTIDYSISAEFNGEKEYEPEF